MSDRYDVAVLGAGVSGLATAARLQARGLSTVVVERHGQVGGCAGFFCRRGFSFDVGATTLVDFEADGLGGELLRELKLDVPMERLPGYVAWLPDRTIVLHRDRAAWHRERARVLGDSASHRSLFALLDRLADVFWAASRRGLTLPIRTLSDLVRAASKVPLSGWPLARYLDVTLGDALAAHGLEHDLALRALLGMLVEDTVHASVDEAPLVNASLGITIRGAGISRARGGMFGFWKRFVARYRERGGILRAGTQVLRLHGTRGDFTVETSRGPIAARTIVSALPLDVVAPMATPPVAEKLEPYVERDRPRRGGAIVVFLGVPEAEVADAAWTHHQILEDLSAPLGNGNNMFVSVSAPGDDESAPAGHRAVMISTHCELDAWRGLSAGEYEVKKRRIGARLVDLARRVYPRLGERAAIFEIGTPVTYTRYTGRPDGAVGGARLSLTNANQRAVPHDIGVPGFYLVGDGTWPGLGTVAACLASRDVARRVLASMGRAKWRSTWQRTKVSSIAPSG